MSGEGGWDKTGFALLYRKDEDEEQVLGGWCCFSSLFFGRPFVDRRWGDDNITLLCAFLLKKKGITTPP